MSRPDKFRSKILDLHGKGSCPADISRVLGVSDSYVHLVLRRANLTPNKSPVYLPQEDREELISMIKSGKQYKEIAEYFGTSEASVSRIAIEAGLRRRAPYRKASS